LGPRPPERAGAELPYVDDFRRTVFNHYMGEGRSVDFAMMTGAEFPAKDLKIRVAQRETKQRGAEDDT
jgi:hypothetical protein